MVFSRAGSGAHVAEGSKPEMRKMFKAINLKLDQLQNSQHSLLTSFTEQSLAQNREIEELRRMMRDTEDQFKAQELNELRKALAHTEATPSAVGRLNSEVCEAPTGASRDKTGSIQPVEMVKRNGSVVNTPNLNASAHTLDGDIQMDMGETDGSDHESVAPAPPAPLHLDQSPTPEPPAFLSGTDSNLSKGPIQKMRPTRGRPGRGRGGSRAPVRKVENVVSDPDESSPEKVDRVPPGRFPTRAGFGKARRAGGLTTGRVRRATDSPLAVVPTEEKSDVEVEDEVQSSIQFVAVNQRTTKNTPAKSNAPLLASIGPGVPSAPGSTSAKKIPPPSAKIIARDRKLPANLPDKLFWFTADAIKAITGTRPGKTVAQVTTDNVLQHEFYIVFTPDLHFNPPQNIGDTCELIDLHKSEGELLASRYPVFKKMDKSHFAFYGEYKVGECKMIPHALWQNSDPLVKKKWAEKIVNTSWGSKMLLDKGLRTPGEIRNFTVKDIMDFFNRQDDSKALRLSATSLEFVDFDRKIYDEMVARAESLSNGGMSAPNIPRSSLTTRVPRKSTSAVHAREADDGNVDSPPPVAARKRRKIASGSPVLGSAPDSGRRVSERSRKATQGAQYSILQVNKGGEQRSTPSTSSQWRVESRKKTVPVAVESSSDEDDSDSDDNGKEVQGLDSD
ncbi:hypothetical protein L873DRAFT_1287718 [Choiromyces venosus 120613-1]|uniref:DUF6697 domain-containing protein n=1 Tax=Choiromyces venosus 120613-1 TaxID=1336337 RepID=A0A3N4JCE8_9PEZI|nr:hypothetical protein L873DRAFT_1287718 [Choiromyces venosus 120613-1]